MTIIHKDESQRKAIRAAGLAYVMMVFTAPIGIMYVPGKIIVPGDATATAEHRLVCRTTRLISNIACG